MPLPSDIIVVRSQTMVGRIIRWVTHSWASHVAVYIGGGLVFEAKPGGAGTKPLSVYETTNYSFRIFRPAISKEQQDRFINALIERTGEGYDYGQIISLAIKRLLNLDMKANNARLAICSELVYDAAKEAGIPVPPIPGKYITPGDFLTWNIATEVIE